MATNKPAKKASPKPADKPMAGRIPLASPPPPAAMDDQPAATVPAVATTLHIVGIGASAGGLEAFEAFFRACPPDTGMAFVLVPHLDPGHESLLTEILQRSTAMPVVQALDQVAVVADHVYVIPPNREMAILNGVLQLSVPELVRGRRMPIDAFLRSLAEDQVERAIGIILSGTATDGTFGLRAILGAGGVCMVQDPVTAKYDGMPSSAIKAGYATHILPADRMPAMLLNLARQASFRIAVPAVKPEKVVNGMNQILLQLRSSTGHDFSLYKKSTIGRRIERRMAQHAIDDLAVYARFLKENPDETQKLFKELLINVTSFFRDPGAFVTLKDTILPPMLASKPSGYVFRVWVAGCASGEEAYSIAIVLLELQDEIKARHEQELSIQIYATDLDDDAIATARAGRFPPNIAQDVTPERLHRFFTKDEAGYKVKKDIRDMVVFAVQSVIKDPPFTKLDLLSCRNLLIYLEPEQQNRLIPTFHYSLKPDGVLFLSASESITSQPDLFTALDRKWKFYRAVHSGAATHAQAASYATWAENSHSKAPEAVMNKLKQTNFDELTRRVLLRSYAPASVVTDLKGNILYVYGDTGRYLRPAPGQATLNVVEMAREGLQLELRSIFLSDPAHATPTLNREISVKTNGGFSLVSFSVRRMPTQHGAASAGAEAGETLLLVSFQDVAESVKPAIKPTAGGRGGKPGKSGGKSVSAPTEQQHVEQLERELAYARESQQATTEEQQAFNEELKSTNEELQSTNEELQSSNEELETAKEELQSLNEEMVTVNSELNAKIEQMSDIQNDVKNLMDSSSIGTLFIDHHLLIRRYTPAAVKVYRVIPSDIGRPLADIKSNIEGNDLLAELQTVLDTLIPIEREVRATDGAWYLAHMQPYRTLDNIIAGVVLTFTTVTDFKRASEAVQRSEERYRSLLESLSAGVVVHAPDTSILLSNAAAAALLGFTEDQMLGKTAMDPGWGFLQENGVRMPLEDYPVNRVIASGERLLNHVVGVPRAGHPEPVWLRCTAYPISDEAGQLLQVVVTFIDITESREAERIKLGVVQLARELAEGIVNTVSEPLLVLDSSLQVVSAGHSFYQHFHVTPEDTVGRKIYDLGNGQWAIPALRELLENILPQQKVMDGYVVEHDFPGLGPRRMVLNARRIVTALGNTELILLAMVAIEPVEQAP